MRIGELSQRSGVPIPTIKYYLRERLLGPGTATAANQADYGEDHVRRLRLIRALLEVGGVSVATARDVIDSLGRTDVQPHDLLGIAHHAVMPARRPDRGTAAWARARAEAERFAATRGWHVDPRTIAFDQLADVLDAVRSLDVTEILDNLDAYADRAQEVARFEVESVIERRDPVRMLELVVLGTVLGEALFGALRLLAHEHESALQLGEAAPLRGEFPKFPTELAT
jgi:DNA-binding transcriptional MerR regulator